MSLNVKPGVKYGQKHPMGPFLTKIARFSALEGVPSTFRVVPSWFELGPTVEGGLFCYGKGVSPTWGKMASKKVAWAKKR